MDLLTPEIRYQVYVNRHPVEMVVVDHDAQLLETLCSDSSEEASAVCAGWIRSAEPYVLNAHSLLTVRAQTPEWFVASIRVSPLAYNGTWKETGYGEARERFAQGDATFLAGIPSRTDSLEEWCEALTASHQSKTQPCVERARPYTAHQIAQPGENVAAAAEVEEK
jgi:hypothetical protein